MSNGGGLTELVTKIDFPLNKGVFLAFAKDSLRVKENCCSAALSFNRYLS